MRLVLASNNAKKLAELKVMLEPIGLELVTQGSLGIAEAEEPHGTFIENALTKARQAARASGCAAIADDSGLCVPALAGEPGVKSAEFAAVVSIDSADREERRRAQDAANNALLLERLVALGPQADRGAYFVSTLVALRDAEDPEPLIATGRWAGTVLEAPRGVGGFGYDPLLFIPALGATVAELPSEVKNRHSHRAVAAEAMRHLMASVWRV